MADAARSWTKRAIDVAVASAALVASFPLMVAIGSLVRLTNGPPVIFRQSRPGLNEKPFNILKFRTMRPSPSGLELPDDVRLTALGRLLRRTSLDELPELINVIRGEMSLVGPRPLLTHYLPRYDEVQRRRHRTRPGLTGLAQVNGRNETTWERRLALDVQYVENWSIWLDVRILCRTIKVVLHGKGGSQPGHATMPEFAGSGAPNVVPDWAPSSSEKLDRTDG